MALPVDMPKVEVTFGPYTDAVGDPIPGYLLQFVIIPPCELVWTDGSVVVPKRLDRRPGDDGRFVVILPATDAVGLNVEPGWTFEVQRPKELGGGTVYMALPADTPQVDFDKLVPIPVPGSISPVLVPADWVAQAQAAAQDAAASASAAQQSATDAGADAEAAAEDRTQTGQDRVQTGADRQQTGLDVAATGEDRAAVSADREAVEQLVGDARGRTSFVIDQGDPVPARALAGDLVFVVDPASHTVSAALVTEE